MLACAYKVAHLQHDYVNWDPFEILEIDPVRLEVETRFAAQVQLLCNCCATLLFLVVSSCLAALTNSIAISDTRNLINLTLALPFRRVHPRPRLRRRTVVSRSSIIRTSKPATKSSSDASPKRTRLSPTKRPARTGNSMATPTDPVPLRSASHSRRGSSRKKTRSSCLASTRSSS